MRNKIIVLFEVNIKEGCKDKYLELASKLKEELKNYNGFISANRFSLVRDENKLLSMTVWKDELAIEKWRNNLFHRKFQSLGRKELFEDYKITIVSPIREYSMLEREKAPNDSNQALLEDK